MITAPICGQTATVQTHTTPNRPGETTMSQEQLLPAIHFLEDRIDALIFALNYLRNHAGLEPCELTTPGPTHRTPKSPQ